MSDANKTAKITLMIVTVGIPCTGKTTWAKKYHEHHKACVYISNDDIRQELTGSTDCIPEENEKIYTIAKERAKKAIEEGHDVLLDGTHVDHKEWIDLKFHVGNSSTLMVARIFNKNPDEAEKLVKMRERKIPRDILDAKWKKLEESKPYLPLIFNWVDEEDLF